MKTLFTLLVFSAGLLNSLADLRLYEPFNYGPIAGDLSDLGLEGRDGQVGTDPDGTGFFAPNTGGPSGTGAPWGYQNPYTGNYWMGAGYSGFTPYNHVNGANILTATDLIVTGLDHPVAGGSVTLGGGGISPRIAFPAINNDSGNGTSQYAYYSLAFQIPANGLSGTAAAGGLVAGFNNTRGAQQNNPSTVGCALFVKTNGSGFVLGVLEQGAGAANATFDSTVLSFDTTYFVVGKYTINGLSNSGTTDDTAQIWINPLSATFGGSDPGGALVALVNANDVPTNLDDGGNTIQTFLLRQTGTAASSGAATSIIIDELRIGTTWADVTPVPEPGTTALALIGGLTILALRRFRSRN